jgi:class 3 adenylate cyclase/tetratricopeptide (TPR) repeat protein
VRENDGSQAAGGDIRGFLIADIRGYTRYTVERGDEAAAQLAVRFATIVREIVEAHQGEVVELRGDEALAVFASARQALRGAVALQTRLAGETLPGTDLPFKVGIGLDAGEAIPVERGYRGGALNLAARLCSLAGPGEVLVSEGMTHLAGKVDGLRYQDRGAVQFKGFVQPVQVVQVQMEAAEVPASGEQGMDEEGAHPLPIGGFLGALPAVPLVARHEELNRVLSAVDAVTGGSGRLVFLVGEPGVGKTRLAQEVTLELRNAAFLVASGRCYEPQEVVPFYPFLEALETLVAAAPHFIRDAMPQRWPYLAQLLPGAGLAVPPASSEGREEQERLFWSVTGFLQAVAEQVPVAVLLDDLHWADASSLALLQHLARHTRAYRVLLIGTYRDIEVGRQHPLERALRDLNREGLTEQIPIRRLGAEGTAALIATVFGQEAVSEGFSTLVHGHTEGNPFFTHEVLRTLVERGDIYQEHGRWERRRIEQIEVPESVRSAIGERLSRLPEGTQELLNAASVVGQTFHFDALAAMADRSEEQVDQALEAAINAGLIREIGRDKYSFNHALTQHALYADLSSRRRRRLHLAAGEALEPRGASEGTAAELAWHFLAGDDPERAARHSIRAGHEAEKVYAHQEAERHYHTALELARATGDQAGEAVALEKLGGVVRGQGRYNEALDLLEQAAALYRAAVDREGQGRTEAEIGMAHYQTDTAEEGIARLHTVLPSLEHYVAAPVLAALYAALVQNLYTAGQYEENLAATERYLDVARATNDQGIFARAYGRYGLALAEVGHIREGTLAYEEALSLADAAGDPRALLYTPHDLAELYELDGKFEKAMPLRLRYLELTEQLGNPDDISLAHFGLGKSLVLLGEWGKARDHLERAESLSHSCTASFATTWPLIGLGWLYGQGGEYDAANTYLEAALATAQQKGDSKGTRFAQCVLAELDLTQGRPEAAVVRLEPVQGRPGMMEGEVVSLVPVLAEARLALADDAESLRQVEISVHEFLDRVAGQSRLQLVQGMRVQGLLLGRKERWDRAEDAFREAVSLARSMPYPYAEARARYEWGRVAGTRGETTRSRERLEEALHIFRRLGAQPYVQRTERALAGPR